MTDIIVSLTNTARKYEAQGLLYGYGFRIDYFSVGSGGHDPSNPTLALPLDLDVTDLPGQFFGPQPIDSGMLVSPTCPQWTCVLQPGQGVGQISNFALLATVTFIPQSSILLTPSEVIAGNSEKTFTPLAISLDVSPTHTSFFNVPTHGFVNDNKVIFATDGTLPVGLTATTEYYVVNAITNSFQVSLTSGGTALALTSAGTGTHTVRLTTDDTFSVTNHGLANNTPVSLLSNKTIPAGLLPNKTYYVVYATLNTFKLSETTNGAPINFTSSGDGVLTVTNLDSTPAGAPAIGSTFLYAIANFPASYKLSSARETFIVNLQT